MIRPPRIHTHYEFQAGIQTRERFTPRQRLPMSCDTVANVLPCSHLLLRGQYRDGGKGIDTHRFPV